ncbi:MAG: DEAD/DEAH box helicase [Candidatus Eremiobacteraeota bacterium]|nr:DEAD/DEAH box helicase [Candidatus Eremiobacteraeota bacterium]
MAQGNLNAPKKAPATKTLPPPTASEVAFEAALAALSALPTAHRSDGDDMAGNVVDRLFAQADRFLTDPYSTIGDAPHFHTKIAGVSFEGRQDIIAGLHAGAPLQLLRQPNNPHDANAIAVHYGDLQLGFFNKRLAAHIAPRLDEGVRYTARVASLTGGPSARLRSGQAGLGEAKHRGVNIFVERAGGAPGRRREKPHAMPSDGDRGETAARVRSALIGEAVPHDAQRAVLERIDAERNTLAVMGTGRGKSFCFQFAAAMRAFCDKGKTLVIYPLRALANDQYEAVRRTLEPLGLRCFRANGSIDNDEREELFAALASGSWDVILSTPEFLEFHHAAFVGESRPSLAVIDEAHHVHESRHRPAYAQLAATVAALGNPQVLALTATAADDAFRRIRQELGIETWVIDPTIRENLNVVDARGTRDKHRYLVELLRSKENRGKCIVYCNSRGEATTVAKRLRKELGDEVMFYHAKMPNRDRLEVERLFRDGALRVVIATSAFGEGIDLPDVADVVLYHLNFDFGEFNQQAGRAGRNGAPANVHLLYGHKDRALNEYLIDLDAPPIGLLREIYGSLKRLARGPSAIVHGGDAEIAGLLDNDRIRDRHVTAALRIFADASLVEIDEDDRGRFVRLLPVSGRIEMERNERYAEGEATREAFTRFAEMALSAPASTLERIINRPIYPSRVALRQ